MAYPFRGNIDGEVVSAEQGLPMSVDSFQLVNKTAATIGVNVYMVTGYNDISIMPLNTQLAAGEMFYADTPIVMLATDKIKIKTSSSTDYNFTIKNMPPDNV